MRATGRLLAHTVAAQLLATAPAGAHHSYSMFDDSQTLTVQGTVAKVEWMNPHVFVWIHVPNPQAPGTYALYAFENGSVNVLARLGWTKYSLAAREKITVDYFPLKDGRPGGHFIKGTLADGRVLRGAGGPGVRAPNP